MARQVADPDLRAKLTPTYTPGCKRLLQSNEYYPALQRPNVTLETEKIVEVQPDGVVTADGALHEVDTIIYGTGFRITNNPMAERIHGVDGRSLKEHWAGTGMRAYCGTTIPGFPNYFMLAGPNTGIGHTSLVVMIEAQLAHVVGAFRALRDRGATCRRRAPRHAGGAGAHEVQRKAAPTVWNSGGCSSWYLDEAGRNTTLWPDYTYRFVRRTRTFDANDYVLDRPPPVVVKRPPITLEGATALVTGAGSGIGRATAHALAARGATVLCTDIDEAAAEKTVAECTRTVGCATSGVPARRGGSGGGRRGRVEDRRRTRSPQRPGEQRRRRHDGPVLPHDGGRVGRSSAPSTSTASSTVARPSPLRCSPRAGATSSTCRRGWRSFRPRESRPTPPPRPPSCSSPCACGPIGPPRASA